MESIAVSSTVTEIRSEDLESDYQRVRKRWMTTLLVSSIAAALTGTFGLLLSGASLLHIISSRGRLGIAGAVLLAATFPLMVLAAHCLDKADDADRSYKIALYKRRVFGDFDREIK